MLKICSKWLNDSQKKPEKKANKEAKDLTDNFSQKMHAAPTSSPMKKTNKISPPPNAIQNGIVEDKSDNLTQINNKIYKYGYGSLDDGTWTQIGIGNAKKNIGEKTILFYGNGNIMVKETEKEGLFFAIPTKGTWRGEDFGIGALFECYEPSKRISISSVYDIVCIDKIAILQLIKEKFVVIDIGKLTLDRVQE